MAMLSHAFFLRPCLKVARDLIGMKLETFVGRTLTSGIITEVEAYGGARDAASHAHRGRTKRNEVMFWSGGHCYVYLIYGLHLCVNVVTGKEGDGAAVLIRAVQPLKGQEIMRYRRGLSASNASIKPHLLTTGPGRLSQALAVGREMLGEDLLKSSLIRLSPHRTYPDRQIARSQRIGISKAIDLKWRFFLKNSLYVSPFVTPPRLTPLPPVLH